MNSQATSNDANPQGWQSHDGVALPTIDWLASPNPEGWQSHDGVTLPTIDWSAE